MGKNLTSKGTIMISAGGTGGHVMPALAVAKALRAQGYHVRWIGTQEGLEATRVPEAGIALDIIPKCRVQGQTMLKKVQTICHLIGAILRVRRLIRRHRAVLVVGFGGYVSAACGVGAWLAATPLVIHEQNALAGRTNRLLAKKARKILSAFPNTFHASLPEVAVGNPLRAGLQHKIPSPVNNAPYKPLNILILGGSLGAKSFNEVIPEAVSAMPKMNRPVLWHQSGEKTEHVAKAQYATYQVAATVTTFIDDMQAAYAFADLVICRAGALTLSELCVVGVPAILVPYPYAMDDHQRYNAEKLTEANAAIMILHTDFTAAALQKLLIALDGDRERLRMMAKNMLPLAKPHSTEAFVSQCQQLLHHP